MKITKGLIFFISMVLVFCSLTGCKSEKAKVKDSFSTSSRIVYNAITWAPAEKAQSYKLYANNEFAAETKDNGIILDLDAGEYDMTVDVLLENGKTVEKVDIGKLTVPGYQTVGKYADFESLFKDYGNQADNSIYLYGKDAFEIDLSHLSGRINGYKIVITSSVKKLTVKSDENKRIDNCSFFVQSRDTEMIFDFENVTIRSSETDQDVISFDEKSNLKKAVIFFNGYSNSLTSGYIPKDGAKGKKGAFTSHAGHGGKGDRGGNAVFADEVVIINADSLYLMGSNGGNGGDGGDQDYGSISKHGVGGNGGDGGNGIECQKLTLFSCGMIDAKGGSGGKGGKPGVNGFGSLSDENGSSGSEGQGIKAAETDEVYNRSTKTVNENIPVPKVKLLDHVLKWEKVENADEYVVYINNFPNKTKETVYQVPTDEDVQIQVSAVIDGEESPKSFMLTRLQDTEPYQIKNSEESQLYFQREGREEYVLTGQSAFFLDYTVGVNYLPNYCVIEISPDVNLIKIKTTPSPLSICFDIASRSTPVIFDLEDATLGGVSDRPAIKAEGTLAGGLPNVIIRSNGTDNDLGGGDNTVKGKKGEDADSIGMGKVGENGHTGYSAIDAPVVLIEGTAKLFLGGGFGSDGGDGGNAKPYIGSLYWNEGGSGGNGGKGGDAITADELYVNMYNGISITLKGGKGGIGGNQGKGTNFKNDAVDGAYGVGYAGNPHILSGDVQNSK